MFSSLSVFGGKKFNVSLELGHAGNSFCTKTFVMMRRKQVVCIDLTKEGYDFFFVLSFW